MLLKEKSIDEEIRRYVGKMAQENKDRIGKDRERKRFSGESKEGNEVRGRRG